MHKVKKTIAMMSLLAPMGAGALGVGDIRLHSALNQSLDAEIPLVLSGGDSLDDVKVSLAEPEAFAKAGIERHYFLSKLQFRAVQNPGGGYVIKVSSGDVIREPFLSFLVEVNWPQGRVLREFTVLLDPPSTMPEETVAETAPPLTERPIRQYERVAELSRSGEAAAPSRRSARRSAATAPQQAAAPSAPLTPPAEDQLTRETYGPVRRDETLWSIAKSLKSDPSLTHEQMVMALFRTNPKAFSSGINRLRAGSTLRIPTREFIAQLNPQQAQAEFARQKSGNTGRLTANRGPEPMIAGDESPQSQLKLLAPADSKTKGQNAVAGNETSGGKAKGDLALEVAETAKQENEEFRSRLAQLEQKLADMQRLLTIKDEQIASLKPPQQSAATPPKPAPQPELPAGAQQPAISTAPPKPAVQTQPPSPQPEAAKPAQAEPATTPSPAIPAAAPSPAIPAEAPLQTKPAAASSQATPAETPSQAAPPPKPRPKPAATPPSPATAESENFGLPIDPTYLGAGAALLGLVAWLLKRRRNAMIAETESILLAAERESLQTAQASATKTTEPAYEPMVPSKTSFLSEFTPSDFDALGVEADEVDAISEADVYLAYGRYKQAEELIRHSISQHPERDEYKLKLLEIYHATENRSAFENYALELKAQHKNTQPEIWAKVEEMGRELVPTSSLFQASSSRQEKTAKRSSNASKSLASLDLSDDLIEDLKHFEIQIAEPAPASYDESDIISLDFGAAEAKATVPAEEPSSDTNQHASLDFDIASLDFNKGETSENDSPKEEVREELENLISFDFEKTPAMPPEKLSPAPSEETFDHILAGLTGSSITQDETDSQVEYEIAIPDQTLGESDLTLSLFEPGSGVEAEEESQAESELDEATVDSYATHSTDIDQIETKLDLAKAYADMEDEESASEILQEVLENGNEKQKAEARILLDKMGRASQPELFMSEPRASHM